MGCNKLSIMYLYGIFFFFFTIVHAKRIDMYYARSEFSVCAVYVWSDILSDLKYLCPTSC